MPYTEGGAGPTCILGRSLWLQSEGDYGIYETDDGRVERHSQMTKYLGGRKISSTFQYPGMGVKRANRRGFRLFSLNINRM